MSDQFKFVIKKGSKPHFNIRIGLNDKSSGQEIGYLHLVPLRQSGYMEVLNVEIDPKWQRQGLGTRLYLKAREVAKKAGYQGLASNPEGRTSDASKLWAKIPGAKKKGRGWWVLEKKQIIKESNALTLDQFIKKITDALKKKGFHKWGTSAGRCSEVARAVKAIAQLASLSQVMQGSSYVRSNEVTRAHDYNVINGVIYDWTFAQFFPKSHRTLDYPHIVHHGSEEFNKYYADDFHINNNNVNVDFQRGDELFDFLEAELGLDKIKEHNARKNVMKIIEAKKLQVMIEADPSLQPPKKWFSKMEKKVRANPKYAKLPDERINAIIGSIWYHKMKTPKRKEIRGREGKKYGPASESTNIPQGWDKVKDNSFKKVAKGKTFMVSPYKGKYAVFTIGTNGAISVMGNKKYQNIGDAFSAAESKINECLTYTEMGSSFLEAMNAAGEVICGPLTEMSRLEYLAKQVSSGADFATKTVIQGISMAFNRAPTRAYNALSVLDQDQAQKLFDDLVAQAKTSKLKSMGDVSDYLIKTYNKWPHIKENVVTIDGRKILKLDKPFYHKMPVSDFSDMTERELNKLVHKAVSGTNVHFNLSDLFTSEQLHALENSPVFDQFSRHMKDDIFNAMVGESWDRIQSIGRQLKEFKKKV